MAEISPSILLFVFLVFFVAGGIKGMIGFGFPAIVLSLLALTMDVREAMTLVLIPCFLTNVWQAVSGLNFLAALRRLWPFYITATLATLLTTWWLPNVQGKLLSAILGSIISIYALLALRSAKFNVPQNQQRFLSPVIGLCNGIVMGLTGTSIVPGVLYLQSLGLRKDILIQAMGILFVLLILALGAGLFSNDLFTPQHALLSTAAMLPTTIGMLAGQYLRKSISERQFRFIFLLSLLLLGCFLLLRSLA